MCRFKIKMARPRLGISSLLGAVLWLGLWVPATATAVESIAFSVNAGGGAMSSAAFASVGSIGQGQGLGLHASAVFCHYAGFIQADRPGAPTGLHASATNYFDFTASWHGVSWVDQYVLDVSLYETFGIPGDQETVVGWDFTGDTPIATTGLAVNAAAEIVTTAAGTVGYINSTTGNRAISVNGWDTGAGSKFWQVSFNASGQANLRVSSVQRSSNTGPKAFQLQYRIGPSGAWAHVPGGSVTVANNYTTGVLHEVPLPAACDNQEAVYLRWIMTSNEAVNLSPVAGTGTSAMDQILIVGDAFTPSFVPGYEQLAVAGTSQGVEGLAEDTTYYFRIRADSACLSGYSEVRSVITRERPIPRISIDSLVHDETAYMDSGRVVTNYMFVYANNETLFAFDGSQGLERVFEVTDAWLANLSEADDLQVHFGSWDPEYGLNRNAHPPAGQEPLYTRMTIDPWFTENHSGFDLSRSSPDPVISMAAATNVWRFTEPVAGDTINDMMVTSNRISATIVNTVGGTRANQPFGWLNVIDDDTTPPQVGANPLTVLLGDVPLPTAEQTVLVAGWNFNDAENRTVASQGSGTFASDLAHALSSFGGSGLNLMPEDEAGSDIAVTTTANIGRHIQFEVDMTGLRALLVTFAAQRSSTGYDDNTVSYAVNGGDFVILQSGWVPGTSYGVHTFDLSGEPDVDGATSVVFRIEFGINTATGGGNNRFDNVQFNATRTVHQITDAQLASVGAATPLRLSLNVYDVDSGIYRGTVQNGLNMRISVPGIATDNTVNYVAAMSSSETRSGTSTSVWEFASGFTPGEVGDLFEARYLPVTASVSDRDNDRPGDNLWLTDALFGVIEVVDDDDEPPTLANVNFPGAAARPFMILTNGVASPAGEAIRGGQLRREGSGIDTVFKLSDADLVHSGTRGLQFVFGAVDMGSGVARGAAGSTNTVMTFSIGDLLDGNVFLARYDASLSSGAAGPGDVTTNVWTFPNGFFTYEMIDTLIEAGQQPIYVTIPDADNDRPGDQSVLHNVRVGYLHVIDDDIRGPLISAAGIRGAVDEEAILFSAFEASEGWPSPFSSTTGTHDWTHDVAGRIWVGRGAFRTTFPPILSGVQRFGLLTSTYADPWLQLPPLDHPGVLTLYAGRFGTAAQDITIRVERFDGEAWIGMGDRVVTNRNPTYELYSWDLDLEGENILLRITRDVGSGNQVYLEDVSVIPRSRWMSTHQLEIFWTAAIDDFNHVDEYRLVEPGFSTSVPTAKSDGAHVGAAVTNYWVDIAGLQGELTGYVFAIDDDNDRPKDRAMGNIMQLIARIDTNPPIAISGLGVGSDAGIDDLSEVRLEWTVPGNSEAEAAGWRQSDFAPLSPWQSYRIYYTREERDPTADDAFVDRTVDAALGAYETDTVVLTDFAFGTTYRLAIAGEDEAGNVGQLSDSITHQFANFIVTQGVAVAASESRIYWQAAEGRTYDLIYADADTYSGNLNGSWQLADRAETNALSDVLDVNGSAMRFYRASPAGRWEPTTDLAVQSENGPNGSRQIASQEIYVAKPITLHPGQNWVALPGIPDTSTVARVFNGARHLPSGSGAINSTRISWFNRQSGVSSKIEIWLDDDVWRHNNNEPNPGLAEDVVIAMEDGMVIEIPRTSQTEGQTFTFLFVGRVPAPDHDEHPDQQVQWIHGNQAYNLINARLPRQMHPSEMNLVVTDAAGGVLHGMAAGLGVSSALGAQRADGLWSLDRQAQGPAGILYYYDGSHASFPHPGWYRVGHGGPTSANRLSPDFHFAVDDALVLRSFRTQANWAWTNPIPYAAPTQFLD